MRTRHYRPFLISLLLLALSCRALVPAGFMPAADGSARLALCQNGMPDMPGMPGMPDMVLPHGGAPHGNHVEHCPFGAAPSFAPLPVLAVELRLSTDLPGLPPASESAPPPARISGAHRARAPPQLA
ncbi:MAG TPA: hypothetical protein VMH77_03155 [Steroidobacteraceae bacterium]|nr:hypothetical protein [Steroidobacteraceae bacterium]